jgi:RNA polymerase sigma-70 factor (ECF subfamily)
MAGGSERGLELVEPLEGDLGSYHLFHSARADLLRRLGRSHEAAASYRRALDLAPGDVERAFLERRLAEAGSAPAGSATGPARTRAQPTS